MGFEDRIVERVDNHQENGRDENADEDELVPNVALAYLHLQFRACRLGFRVEGTNQDGKAA